MYTNFNLLAFDLTLARARTKTSIMFNASHTIPYSSGQTRTVYHLNFGHH